MGYGQDGGQKTPAPVSKANRGRGQITPSDSNDCEKAAGGGVDAKEGVRMSSSLARQCSNCFVKDSKPCSMKGEEFRCWCFCVFILLAGVLLSSVGNVCETRLVLAGMRVGWT